MEADGTWACYPCVGRRGYLPKSIRCPRKPYGRPTPPLWHLFVQDGNEGGGENADGLRIGGSHDPAPLRGTVTRGVQAQGGGHHRGAPPRGGGRGDPRGRRPGGHRRPTGAGSDPITRG